MPHANPIQIQQFLKGVDYPASKEQLLDNARRLGADESICASLEQLPDEDFETPADVSQAFRGPASDDVGKAEQSEEADVEKAPAKPRRAAGQGDSGSKEFLAQVIEDSMAEIELCMLALKKSKHAELKEFAQKMLDEHGRFAREIEELAQKMTIALPNKLRAEGASRIEEMEKLKGDAFDKRFVETNVEYHENDLKVFQHYASEERDEDLKQLAETGAYLFTKHLSMARKLKARLSKK